MKKLRLFSLLLVLLLGTVFSASAQELPCPPPPCPPGALCPQYICPPQHGPVFTNPSWLKIDYHRVNVEIDNQIAHTNVDMKFVNEGEGMAEGTFVFPLPLGASVDSLTMYINDTPIEAQILRRTPGA